MNAFSFLAEIIPSLVELGSELFSKHGGDAAAAHVEILSHVAELRRGREALDAAADKKFGP